MILFEGLTQLDFTGPYEVFSRFPETSILVLSKAVGPVRSENGIELVSNKALCDWHEDLDVLFVPGGRGIHAVMEDPVYMNFIRNKSKSAKFVTSVCTGSLVLAAAGALQGYMATTHWLSLDLLEKFGITTSTERVVVDRNRITGGGVTSGIDFALVLAAKLLGEDKAKELQLIMEYNPQPPFNAGHPSVAEPSLVERIRAQRKEIQQKRSDHIDKVIQN